MHNHPAGCEGVLTDLKTTPTPRWRRSASRSATCARFSNYLTPRLGMFSADTWTLGATLLRNVLLNWIVLLSWLAALLLIPRFCVLVALARPGPAAMNALLVAAFAGFTIATAYAAIDLPGLGTPAGGRGVSSLAGWWPMFGGVVCFLAWWAGFRNGDKDALLVLNSSYGLPMSQLFVGAATAAGCLVAACVLAWRTRAKAERRPAFLESSCSRRMLLVTVLLTGALSGYFGVGGLQRASSPTGAGRAQFRPALAAPLVLAPLFRGKMPFHRDHELVRRRRKIVNGWGRAGGWLGSAIVA
jgi:hypothetical protein